MRLIDADKLAKTPIDTTDIPINKCLDVVLMEDIENAPTVGEWIPVSERLPEIGQKVLASTKGTVFTQVYKGIYSEPNVWHWNHNSIKVVTAWMPLPTPYKGGDS